MTIMWCCTSLSKIGELSLETRSTQLEFAWESVQRLAETLLKTLQKHLKGYIGIAHHWRWAISWLCDPVKNLWKCTTLTFCPLNDELTPPILGRLATQWHNRWNNYESLERRTLLKLKTCASPFYFFRPLSEKVLNRPNFDTRNISHTLYLMPYI